MSHLRTVLPYLRPYRRGIAAGLVLVVIANGFTILGPWILKLAVDAIGDPGTTRRVLVEHALLIVGVAVLAGAARYGMRELLNGISRRVECDLRRDFFARLLVLDAAFYARHRTGDIMSRATNDTLAVRQAAGPALMYAVNTSVMSVFTLAVMLWIDVRLTLLALIPMVLLPPVVLAFGRVIHRRFERIQEQFSSLSTLVQENLTGIRLVRAYVQEEDQARRFREMNREYMDRNLHLVKAQGLFHPILSLLTGVAMIVVLWAGGRQVVAGAISIGDFVAFAFYVNLLTWPMVALGWVVNLFQRGEASMGRINAILQARPEILPGSGRPVADAVRGEVEFRSVSFRYPGTEREVLRDVSFRVAPGETVAVVGATGSGKSTLVSLIPRLHDPSAGAVLLDGVPVRELDPASLRRVVGIVPQDAFLFSETIATNVGLGLEADPLEMEGIGDLDPRVVQASRVAQLHEQVEGFPRGYGTWLGERGINLSGGQKQRATLARALARDPAILVLDDALSAVDTGTEALILEELRGALAGRTAFLVSHRVSAVMNADRILVLDDGRLVEEGTHDALLALGGTYAALLRRQLLERAIASEEDGDADAGAALAGVEG